MYLLFITLILAAPCEHPGLAMLPEARQVAACELLSQPTPETIERALLAHPQVRGALVFGAPSPEAERSDIVVACVVAGAEVTAETLRQFLLAQLPAWQVPREWRFVESLAPNQRGKLSRAGWRARLGFGTPG